MPLNEESDSWAPHPLEVLQASRKKRGLSILTASVLAIILAIGAGWWFGSGPGGLATVPNLTNRTLSDAQQSLLPLDAQLTNTSEYSSEVAAGLIIRTEPSSGTLFFKGAGLQIVISKGAKLIAVPAIAGLSAAKAESELVRAGFKLGTVTYWFNDAAKATVFDYLGSDLTKIGEGTEVSVKLSLGPLPIVAGLAQEIAIATIQAAGLQIDTITQEFSDTVAKGQTMRISPLVDPLPKNGKVNLVVSKGSSVFAMPVVIGETLSAAEKLLTDLGLKVLVNTDQLKSNYGLTNVRTVSVPAGKKVRVGDTVTISNLK